MRDMGAGLAIAIRRWPIMFPLAGIIAVACAVLSLILSSWLIEVTALRGARRLHERQAIAFSPYAPPGVTTGVGKDTVQYLAEIIDRRGAYTAVVGDMGPDDPDFPGGQGALILFGEVVSDLFPYLQPGESMPLPFAMRGARFAGRQADVLNVAGESILVVGTLPAGATFFDMGRGVLPLDHRVVIRAPARMLPLLGPIAREEALLRAVMFAPADEVVEAYVAGCARGGLLLVPFAAIEYLERHEKSLPYYAMSSGAMLSLLLLAFAAFMSSARSAIRDELGTFEVRAGARAKAIPIGLRIAGFLAAVILGPPVVVLSLIALAGTQVAPGTPGGQGVPWVLLAVLLAYVGMWLALVRDALGRSRMSATA